MMIWPLLVALVALHAPACIQDTNAIDLRVDASGGVAVPDFFARAATARSARDHFREHGFAHVRDVVSGATLGALRAALAHARADAGAASAGGDGDGTGTPGPSLKFGFRARAFHARGINDYVAASPTGDAAADARFWRALRRLAAAYLFGRAARGGGGRGVVIAERHFKVYGNATAPAWGAHKDRFASELVVGLVLRKPGARARFAVCTPVRRFSRSIFTTFGAQSGAHRPTQGPSAPQIRSQRLCEVPERKGTG